MDNSTITTISIRNFKGIEDLQLNAKKLNAIIGNVAAENHPYLMQSALLLQVKLEKKLSEKDAGKLVLFYVFLITLQSNA